MKTKLEDKNFISEIINKNRRNGGVSLNILTINSKMFDRSITKDVKPKISSLLGLSITQEATYPLGSWQFTYFSIMTIDELEKKVMNGTATKEEINSFFDREERFLNAISVLEEDHFNMIGMQKIKTYPDLKIWVGKLD